MRHTLEALGKLPEWIENLIGDGRIVATGNPMRLYTDESSGMFVNVGDTLVMDDKTFLLSVSRPEPVRITLDHMVTHSEVKSDN